MERRGEEVRRTGRDLKPGPAGYSHALVCHAVRSVLGFSTLLDLEYSIFQHLVESLSL